MDKKLKGAVLACFFLVFVSFVFCCMGLIAYSEAVKAWESTALQKEEMYNYSMDCFAYHFLKEANDDPYFSSRIRVLNDQGG